MSHKGNQAFEPFNEFSVIYNMHTRELWMSGFTNVLECEFHFKRDYESMLYFWKKLSPTSSKSESRVITCFSYICMISLDHYNKMADYLINLPFCSDDSLDLMKS